MYHQIIYNEHFDSGEVFYYKAKMIAEELYLFTKHVLFGQIVVVFFPFLM